MKRRCPVRTLGITGGLGTGKSTALALLARRGFDVLDADKLAHGLLEPGGAAYRRVIKLLGPEILGRNGRISRKEVAARVFGNASALKALNAIVHPPVKRQIRVFLKQHRKVSAAPGAVSVPLLYETGMQAWFDRVVVVKAPSKQARERLRASRGMTQSQMAARIKAQMPLSEKSRRADFVLDNSGTKKDLARQVRDLLRRIKLGG